MVLYFIFFKVTTCFGPYSGPKDQECIVNRNLLIKKLIVTVG